MRRNDSASMSWWTRLSSNVPIRNRSERSSSRSTSATDRRGPLGKRSELARLHAVLPDHGLAVPGQVGRGFAFARRGVDVRSQAARRRRAGQQAAVLGPADRDRAAGQVRDHRRARERGLGARRYRHEHVLADLDVKDEAGQIGCGEQQVGTERHLRDGASPAHPDDAAHVVARGHLTALVELAVGRQIRLRRHAEHAGRGGSRRRCCRCGAGSAAARRPPAPAADRPRPPRCRAARLRPHPAAHPASGCPRSNSPTASARETPPARHPRRGTPAPPPARIRRWSPAHRSRCAGCRRPRAQSPGRRRSRSPSPSIVARRVSRTGDGVSTIDE